MTKQQTTEVVDELGRVRAKIADLAIQEDRLKSLLRKQGPGAYEGGLFRATVGEPGEREVFDVEWAKQYVGPRLVKAHTSYAPVTPRVCVVARLTDRRAA